MNKTIIRFSLFYIFTIAFSCVLSGKGYFDFHIKAQAVYNDIFELRLNEARSAIANLKKEEPNNLIVYHLEDYVDFFTIYVPQDYEMYKSLVSNRDKRLDKIESEGNPNSPYHLFIQAEIRLHWALLRLRFEEYIPAFRDINKAHKLLLKNQELFPSFLANKKDLGILHAAVGTVPDNFRWALELLTSLEGTIEQGKREIEYVISQSERQNFPYLLETKVLHTFLLLHLDGRPEAAWAALKNTGLDASKTPLHAFVLANVAMRTGRNDQAINWIQSTPSKGFIPFSYLDYMLGVAKLRRLNTAGKQDLRRFIATTKGEHFIKEAYQKLAWAELLDSNMQGYKTNMQRVLNNGIASTGGDESAEKEARDNIVPNIYLLKARLLFDGGYYPRAYRFLSSFKEFNFPFYIHKIEYNYRLGRILDGLNRADEAINQYNKTIAIGRTHEAFYACNAALRAGLIEEKNGHKAKAKSYFNLCLELDPADYSTGLHLQAKAGLVRVKQ